jgi:hypothetical protein
MYDCQICGKFAQLLDVFGRSEYAVLCKSHRDQFDKLCDANEDRLSDLINAVAKLRVEARAVKIVYTGLGPERLTELTEKLFAVDQELFQTHNKLMDVADEFLKRIKEEYDERG